MKIICLNLYAFAYLFFCSIASAQQNSDEQNVKIATILEALAAQEESIQNQSELIEKLKKIGDSNIQPVGSIIFMASETAPAGYLYCDGSARNRAEFKELFAAIGTTWGKGDGSTTFNLPDLRGEFIRVWSKDGKIDAGRKLGQPQGQSTALPNAPFSTGHYHSTPTTSPFPTNPSNIVSCNIAPETDDNSIGGGGHGTIAGTGGDAETRPRNQALACFIKAVSDFVF